MVLRETDNCYWAEGSSLTAAKSDRLLWQSVALASKQGERERVRLPGS